MRPFILILIVLGLVQPRVTAQDTNALAATTTDAAASAIAEEEADDGWAFSISSYLYVIPDDGDYAQPTITADWKKLHLEARYNYEDLETGSVWVGCNFSFGDKISLEVTPMLGGVFGETTGIAPGYKYTLSWWKLELYGEGEYLFDANESDDNFFYSWTELSLYPVDWFRFGGVFQRTKSYEMDLEVQRGLLAGFSYKCVDFTAYVFDLCDEPTVVLGLTLSF